MHLVIDHAIAYNLLFEKTVPIRGVRIQSDFKSESDPIGLVSKFKRPHWIGSDFMAFISDWIGFCWVFPDQIGIVFRVLRYIS